MSEKSAKNDKKAAVVADPDATQQELSNLLVKAWTLDGAVKAAKIGLDNANEVYADLKGQHTAVKRRIEEIQRAQSGKE